MSFEKAKKIANDLIEKVELLDKLISGDISETELKKFKAMVEEEIFKAFEAGACLSAFLAFSVKMRIDALLMEMA